MFTSTICSHLSTSPSVTFAFSISPALFTYTSIVPNVSSVCLTIRSTSLCLETSVAIAMALPPLFAFNSSAKFVNFPSLRATNTTFVCSRLHQYLLFCFVHHLNLLRYHLHHH